MRAFPMNPGYIVIAMIFVALVAAARHRKLLLTVSSLTAERSNLEQLLLDIRDGTKKFYTEKRKHKRVFTGTYVSAKIIGKNPSGRVRVRDISYGGALIRTQSYFEIGEKIDINFYLPLFAEPICIGARVARAVTSPDSDGFLLSQFDLGLEFIDISRNDSDKLVETVNVIIKEKSRKLFDKTLTSGAKQDRPDGNYVSLRKKYFNRTIRTLMCFIDYKDLFTRGHSENVVKYSVMIAEALGFGKRRILTIKIAALFHDIGKFKIDRAILNKPGKLNHDEWRQVMEHPNTSANIIQQTGIVDEEIADIIKYHHERYGDKGYPEPDRRGERIPIGSRIIAVADSYDAMTSMRPYRAKPMTKKEALEEIRRYSGTQFDPRVVEVFMERMSSSISSAFKKR